MKRPVERQNQVATCMVPSQLQRRLDGLRTRVGEEHLRVSWMTAHGCHGGKLLAELDDWLVVEVGARHVQEAGSLVADGGDHLGMAVAGGADGDAGCKIQKVVAVHVDG